MGWGFAEYLFFFNVSTSIPDMVECQFNTFYSTKKLFPLCNSARFVNRQQLSDDFILVLVRCTITFQQMREIKWKVDTSYDRIVLHSIFRY